MLTPIEQETISLCDELRIADPSDLKDWIEFIKAWFETDDEYKGFRQQMRETLKTDSFQYPDPASPYQPSGKFMDFYGKNGAIALAILREWASIAVLKAIPRPTTAPTWDRWLEEAERDGITTYEGITGEEFKKHFGGQRYAKAKSGKVSKLPATYWEVRPPNTGTDGRGSEVSRRRGAA